MTQNTHKSRSCRRDWGILRTVALNVENQEFLLCSIFDYEENPFSKLLALGCVVTRKIQVLCAYDFHQLSPIRSLISDTGTQAIVHFLQQVIQLGSQSRSVLCTEGAHCTLQPPTGAVEDCSSSVGRNQSLLMLNLHLKKCFPSGRDATLKWEAAQGGIVVGLMVVVYCFVFCSEI